MTQFDWQLLLFIIGGGLLLWVIIRMVRNNPGSFNRESLGKSFWTVGLLTLMIIVAITVCVILLRMMR